MAAAPLGPFVRFAIAKTLAYWLTHGGLSIFDTSAEVDPLDLRRAVMTFDRPGADPVSTRDDMQTSVVFMKTDGGVFSGAWDDDDLEAVETALAAWWDAANDYYPTTVRIRDVRWFAEGPDAVPPNPVIRETSLAHTGASGTQSLPPQVASTITFKTASRKHWGRIYLPAPASTNLEPTDSKDGRWSTTFVDAMCNDFATAMAALAFGANILPVVYSPSAGTALGITAYQVDDVPDVIRRRRFASVGYRKVVSA